MKNKTVLKNFYPYLYIIPIYTLLIVFTLVPLGMAVTKSFYRYDTMSINTFIGLTNYKNLLFDYKFWKSMQNLLFFLCGMTVCMCFPIVTAKLVHSVKREGLQYFFRTSFIVTIVVPLIVTMLMWKFIYYPEIGVFAKITEALHLKSVDFLGNKSLVKYAITFIGFPWVSGLNFIVIYSALQSIDSEIVEAARIDGAGAARAFFKVELPMIKPQIKSLYLLSFIAQIQDYERIFILTDGGPNNASLLPGLHMYHVAFTAQESMYGYACAMAVVMFVITLTFSIISIRKGRGED